MILEHYRSELDVMMVNVGQAYWNTFLILTKQPQNIPLDLKLPKNLWLGITINRQKDLWRIEMLLSRCGSCNVFVSFEPLYESLGDINLEGINWIIIGAQTRPNLQPDSYWVWGLRNEALDHNIPVFMKNNLTFANKLQEFPKDS